MYSGELMDYHMHTAVTIDGKMNEWQACERANALGIKEIAFTNHVMLTEPEYTISEQDLKNHWAAIRACRERFPELQIRLGLEMDYYPGREREIEAAVARYEEVIERRFDLVLGSVHHLNGVFFSSSRYAEPLYAGHDVAQLYRDYFAMAARAVESGLYDIMAHPDLIKKYTGVFAPPLAFEYYEDAAMQFVDALVNTGVGIELNTSGLRLAVAELYPSAALLARYLSRARESGIEPVVTIGSDAHKQEHVGAHLAEAIATLQGANHHALARFEQRQRHRVPLDHVIA